MEERGSLKLSDMCLFLASWRGSVCVGLIDSSWQSEPLYHCCVTANLFLPTLPRTYRCLKLRPFILAIPNHNYS